MVVEWQEEIGWERKKLFFFGLGGKKLFFWFVSWWLADFKAERCSF